MRKFSLWLVSAAIFSLFGFSAMVHAQATRTWVSGVGDDANPCSRTAPCKTFAGAISKTAAHGEISVLDPGGFGAVTITKSITINGDGTLAGILAAGTNGVIITAAATDVIVLRNLSINGTGTGTNGIRILQAGNVLIDNVTIAGFTTNGLDIKPTSAGLNVSIKNVTISDVSGIAIVADSGGPRLNVTMSDVNISKCGTGVSAVDDTHVVVGSSVVTACTTGILSVATGAAPRVRLNNSTITANGVGLSSGSGGQIISYQDNRLLDNTTDGTPTSFANPG